MENYPPSTIKLWKLSVISSVFPFKPYRKLFREEVRVRLCNIWVSNPILKLVGGQKVKNFPFVFLDESGENVPLFFT